MIRTLNSLRFILILMIIISHSTLPFTRGMHDYLGEFPVAIFFVISGFVLSLSYGEKLQKGEVTNKHFFLSRIAKLYPLNFFILALTIPLDWRLGYLGSWYQTAAHFLLLQCWIPTHHFVAYINGSAWFISDIIFFYLIFKYLYRWIMEKRICYTMPIIASYMAAFIILSLYIKGDYSASFIYFYPPFRLIDFCIGILIYRIYQKYSLSAIQKKTICHCIPNYLTDTLIILMAASFYYISIEINPNLRCVALYWLPAAIIVYYIVIADQRTKGLSLLLHNKLLLWLGNISFELYLCHELCFRIIQSIFVRIYGEHIPYLGIQFVISLILTILMSWVTKKYIVEPCYKYFKINIK